MDRIDTGTSRKASAKVECHGAELKTPSDNTLKQKKKT
jgi:hypothetical protein